MRTFAALAAILLSGCVGTPLPPAAPPARFLDRLAALCGKAFEGRIVSPPSEADDSFVGRPLVMHVRDCSAGKVRIPFHVGADRSRTWVLTRTASGVRLKHDHRHEDGSEDVLSQYGGDAAAPGDASRQEFPADSYSRALFERQRIAQSAANVWAIEIRPASTFAYELRRPGRFFRVEFDLGRPVGPPPPPWGVD